MKITIRASAKRFFTAATAAAVSLFAATGAAQAQGGMGAPGGGTITPQQRQQMQAQAQARMKAMRQARYKQLNLTPAQITKYEAIETKYQKLAMTRVTTTLQKKYGKNKNPSPDMQRHAMQDAMKIVMPLQKQADKELQVVLNPTQQKKYKEIRAVEMKAMQAMMANRPSMGARPRGQ